MRFQTKQHNRMTLAKAATALIAIVAVLIVGVVCTVLAATNAANSGAYGIYEGWTENLAADVKSNAEEQGLTISGSLDETQFASLFDSNRGFEGVAIVTSSRHVLYDSNSFLGEFISADIEMPREGVGLGVVKFDEKSYVVTVSCVEGDYFAVGYIDFTSNIAVVKDLRTTAIVIGIVSALFIIAAFIAYIISTGLSERGHHYKYKLTTDSEGRIITANDAFKEDFPQTMRIYENVAHFSGSKLTAIKIPCYDDEVFVACSTKKLNNGKVKLSADLVTMPYNAQATKPRDMMNEMYSSFLLKYKTFLIGVIEFVDLPNIHEMFGQNFVERVHRLLYERIAKNFVYIYELDLYKIGVLFPGGKDYSILLEDLKGIVDSYNEPIKIEDNILNVKVKCGFAICDNAMSHRTFEYAMTSVDAALRRATFENQRDYYVFHASEIKAYAKYFFNYDIRRMLADGMFEMEYQPQYGIKEDRVIGFEALFRVKKIANVYSDIFDLITYAERNGHMIYLSEFILDTVMRFAKKVEDKGVTVSLNLSSVQIMQAGFCEYFLDIYNRHELKEGVLCVEITESFLVRNFDYVIKKLDILHEHGVEVHIDDFGTRYSSLLYLKKLPVQVLKIDREFIADMIENEIDRSITQMIVNICNKHNMRCIAEGVETMEQYEALKEMGVDVVQGWLIEKSLPDDEAIKFIDEFKLNK